MSLHRFESPVHWLTCCASVPTDINVFKGLPHGFRRYNQLSESKRWDRVMEDGIRWALAEPSPSRKFIVKLE